jgi:RNA polymerase sigma-70 factor (family 1)
LLRDSSSYEEKELLLKIAEGDEKAFKQVFDRFYSPLVYYASKYVLLEEAEEIVTMVMLKLWQSSGKRRFEALKALQQFLYVSTRNACLDLLKKEQRQKQHEIQLIQQSETSYNSNEDYALQEAELINRIFHEIESLPPKCKQVFSLSYLNGKSTEEIAQSLNITPSTVFNQKARAIKLLKLSILNRIVLFFI